MSTRLLAIGDIHLGRTSRRLPDAVDPSELTPTAALRQAVQTARSQDVSAVLLAGDVADQDHDLYRALSILSEVLAPLTDAGIPIFAVAGNHDHKVLPRLEKALPALRLLGRGGTWETVTIDGPGGPVNLLGWSFPARRHASSPAVGLPSIDGEIPTVGLLHADLDSPGSVYAPVSRGELQTAGPVRWLLGHIHQPSLRTDDATPGYLGSLVGLDPTETGPRGPWLVEVSGSRISVAHLARARLRWENAVLPVAELGDPQENLAAHLTAGLRDFARTHEADLADATAIGVRLRLTGRVADVSALDRAVAAANDEAVLVYRGEQVFFLDQVANQAMPQHDLADLARHEDPPGLLARELLAVTGDEGGELRREARSALDRVDNQSAFATLAAEPPSDDELDHWILHHGYRVLDELLAHREAARDSA